MLVQCLECVKWFEKRNADIKRSKNNFCSRNCSTKYNNRIYKRKIKNTVCNKCRTIFVRINQEKICESCKIDYKNFTLGDYQNILSIKGKHKSWLNVHVRNFNRTWNKNLTELPCKNCGYAKHVELAHIKPISSFDKTTLLSEINDPSNVISLCPNCHWEFDNGLLGLTDFS